MSVRESLFSELQTLCKDARIAFIKTQQELSEFIGNEELIGYCVTKGPSPGLPDTIFDIFLLGNKNLYDYEMQQQGALHHILPLRTISGITEDFEEQEDEKYLSVHFRAAELGTGLILQGKLADKKGIRKFTNAIAGKLG